MELNDRKKLILKAIIANYLETGEPVGSRTIAKHPELNLSSATIRNEMADLEDMGYIFPTLSECNTEICSAVSGGSRTSACSDRYTRQYRKEQDDPGRRTAFE